MNRRRIYIRSSLGGVHRAVHVGPSTIEVKDGALDNDRDGRRHDAHESAEFSRGDDVLVNVLPDESQVKSRCRESAHEINHEEERKDIDFVDGDKDRTDVQSGANDAHGIDWNAIIQDVTVQDGSQTVLDGIHRAHAERSGEDENQHVPSLGEVFSEVEVRQVVELFVVGEIVGVLGRSDDAEDAKEPHDDENQSRTEGETLTKILRRLGRVHALPLAGVEEFSSENSDDQSHHDSETARRRFGRRLHSGRGNAVLRQHEDGEEDHETGNHDTLEAISDDGRRQTAQHRVSESDDAQRGENRLARVLIRLTAKQYGNVTNRRDLGTEVDEQIHRAHESSDELRRSTEASQREIGHREAILIADEILDGWSDVNHNDGWASAR